MFRKNKRAWLRATSGVTCSLVLSAVLVGCGGNASSSNTARDAVAVQTSKPVSAAIIQPNGSPSTTQEPCTDPVDFKRIDSGGNGYEAALVNRHVDCRVSTTDTPIELSTLLARSVDGTYSYYGANTPASSNVNSYTLGTMVISTKLTSYGPSTVLSKSYQFEITVDKFVPDPTYPGADKQPVVLMQPALDCTANFYNDVPGTCTPDQLPQVKVTLDGKPSMGSFVVNFDWVKAATQANDLQAFLVRLQSFSYAVDGGFGLKPPSNFTPSSFVPSIASAPAKLRCDRGVAQKSTQGCVYEQAAAVYVLSTTDPSVSEAAEHVRDAQAGGLPNSGQLGPAPGKFVFKPGTRAIADDSIIGVDKALQRLKDAGGVARQNRTASCEKTNANSLINTRIPVQTSLSCASDRSLCECDEYPFASTWSGGAFSPNTTSVRIINATQNTNAGSGTLSQWYLRERVIDLTVYPDPPDGTIPFKGNGDSFWVHVPVQ